MRALSFSIYWQPFKIRPRLFEFMDKFGAQQEEIELLELENAELERKLTDVSSNLSPTQRASESESREDANDVKFRWRIVKFIASAGRFISAFERSIQTHRQHGGQPFGLYGKFHNRGKKSRREAKLCSRRTCTGIIVLNKRLRYQKTFWVQVQQIFEHLEELFQEEQKKLISRRDKNNELRRKLSLVSSEASQFVGAPLLLSIKQFVCHSLRVSAQN